MSHIKIPTAGKSEKFKEGLAWVLFQMEIEFSSTRPMMEFEGSDKLNYFMVSDLTSDNYRRVSAFLDLAHIEYEGIPQ